MHARSIEERARDVTMRVRVRMHRAYTHTGDTYIGGGVRSTQRTRRSTAG